MKKEGIPSQDIAKLCKENEATPALQHELERAALIYNLAHARLKPQPTKAWRQLLEQYRASFPQFKTVNVVGLSKPQLVYIDSETSKDIPVGDRVPVGLHVGLGLVHRAVMAIENFDPSEHYSSAVDRLGQGKRGSMGGRKPKEEPETIGAWLKNRGYAQSDNKKALTLEAMDYFDVKKSTVNAAASKAGLTRSKRRKT